MAHICNREFGWIETACGRVKFGWELKFQELVYPLSLLRPLKLRQLWSGKRNRQTGWFQILLEEIL